MKVKVVFANTPFAVNMNIDLNRVYDADKVFEPITSASCYYVTLEDGSVIYVSALTVYEVLQAAKPEPTRPEPEFVFGIGRKPEIDRNSKTNPEMKEKEMNNTVKVKVLENFATTLIYGLDFEEIYDATFTHKDTNGLKWYTINTDIAVYTISSQNLKIIEDTTPSEDFLLYNGDLVRVIGTSSTTDGAHLGFVCEDYLTGEAIVVQDYTRVKELSIKDMIMLKDAAPIIVFADGESIYRHYYAYNKSYNHGDEYQEILTYADGCTSHTTSEYEYYDPSDVKFFQIIDEDSEDETNDVG